TRATASARSFFLMCFTVFVRKKARFHARLVDSVWAWQWCVISSSYTAAASALKVPARERARSSRSIFRSPLTGEKTTARQQMKSRTRLKEGVRTETGSRRKWYGAPSAAASAQLEKPQLLRVYGRSPACACCWLKTTTTRETCSV